MSDAMELFTRIIQRLRPPALGLDGMASPSLSLTELHELLDAIVFQRAAAEATILSSPSKRDTLLDQPGTDNAIRRLETEVDAAHLRIERLDRVRAQLDAKIQAATVVTRAEAWAAMRSRLVQQISICQAAMRMAEVAFVQMCDLRLEAQESGFVGETAAMPRHPDVALVDSSFMAMLLARIPEQPMVHAEICVDCGWAEAGVEGCPGCGAGAVRAIREK